MGTPRLPAGRDPPHRPDALVTTRGHPVTHAVAPTRPHARADVHPPAHPSTVRRRAQAGADRPRGARVRCRAARPRTGRSDPVRSAARLQHRLATRRSQAVGQAHPAQPRAGRRHGGGLRLVLAVASPADRVDARGDRRTADRPAARAPGVRATRRVQRTVAVTKRSLILAVWGSWSSSTSTTRTGRASTCWWRSASCCLSCWRRRGRGAPAAGGSSSGCSATRCAARCEPTWSRPSTSGCAACCSVGSSPPVARTSHGSGSP